jgi:hypothetical protein
MRDDEEDAGEVALRKAGMKLPSQIKNKHKRSAEYAKVRTEKIKAKKQRVKERDTKEWQAVELGEAKLARQVPRTIENTREADETVALPNDEELQVSEFFCCYIDRQVAISKMSLLCCYKKNCVKK